MRVADAGEREAAGGARELAPPGMCDTLCKTTRWAPFGPLGSAHTLHGAAGRSRTALSSAEALTGTRRARGPPALIGEPSGRDLHHLLLVHQKGLSPGSVVDLYIEQKGGLARRTKPREKTNESHREAEGRGSDGTAHFHFQ